MNSKEPNTTSSFPSFPSTRWWSKETVAIVTGANKGIGYAMVKRLSELGVTVILTARDNARGLKAVETLKGLGLDVYFHCLDISKHASITEFASWFKKEFGKLDILVNNAAVSYNEIHENSVEHAHEVIQTNYYGPKSLIEALFPFFSRSPTTARVLNLSSRLGLLNKVKNPEIKQTLLYEEQLSEDQIDKIVNLFIDDVKKGRWSSRGWPENWTDYAVSKLALNAYSKVLANRYRGRGLSVNCFCPGHTQTSMTHGTGNYTADAAAELGVNIALIPAKDLPTGKFFLRSSRGVYYNAYSKL
ncbi:(+)-neomenthol dehydrogenase [Heracleum sosnowskyi]|uniref:(+)-neomenthol dehydrogenase n=1 Tax=Heracleum sosnowskyi TaxID=360622 RepID=A0AAD8MN84_9APIA|nr:(+)-neomenthol dehydrogenase [Heracleum sosnowskyi]